MTTILKEIEVSGNGLMKNKYCTVTLIPSKEGCIRFFIKHSHSPVILDVDNVISTNHCIVLGNKKRDSIMLTEHFTAACALSGIDSLDIHVTESEMPILDGSAKNWIEVFMQAGIERAKKEKVKIKEPVYYLNGKTHMVILPDEDLHITYAVNYDHPDLSNRWVSFDKKTVAEIISARTFGFLKDLKKYQLFGYAKGVTYENTVGLDGEGYTTKLRSEYEPIKHKLLDLIGDLYLAGVNPLNLKAQIIVKEAGHAVHVKVAKALKESLLGLKTQNTTETEIKNAGKDVSESRANARAEIIKRLNEKRQLQEMKPQSAGEKQNKQETDNLELKQETAPDLIEKSEAEIQQETIQKEENIQIPFTEVESEIEQESEQKLETETETIIEDYSFSDEESEINENTEPEIELIEFDDVFAAADLVTEAIPNLDFDSDLELNLDSELEILESELFNLEQNEIKQKEPKAKAKTQNKKNVPKTNNSKNTKSTQNSKSVTKQKKSKKTKKEKVDE